MTTTAWYQHHQPWLGVQLRRRKDLRFYLRSDELVNKRARAESGE